MASAIRLQTAKKVRVYANFANLNRPPRYFLSANAGEQERMAANRPENSGHCEARLRVAGERPALAVVG
jgi:hypothetical protein